VSPGASAFNSAGASAAEFLHKRHGVSAAGRPQRFHLAACDKDQIGVRMGDGDASFGRDDRPPISSSVAQDRDLAPPSWKKCVGPTAPAPPPWRRIGVVASSITVTSPALKRAPRPFSAVKAFSLPPVEHIAVHQRHRRQRAHRIGGDMAPGAPTRHPPSGHDVGLERMPSPSGVKDNKFRLAGTAEADNAGDFCLGGARRQPFGMRLSAGIRAAPPGKSPSKISDLASAMASQEPKNSRCAGRWW